MQISTTIDELDRAVVHAIERSPRASWATIAAVVGADAATVARRWQRLEESGIAWATCYPLLVDEGGSAIVELTCASGTALRVARTVARDPRALFVDVVTGAREVLLTAACADRDALGSFVLRSLPAIEGVQAVRTHPIVNVRFSGGFAARGSLDAHAVARLPAPDHGPLLRSHARGDDLDWAICLTFSRDGRATVSDVARATGSSDSTVKRRIARLFDAGLLRMMVELAAWDAGHHSVVWMTARIPVAERDEVTRQVGAIPGVKAITSVAGPDNLLIKVGLRTLSALDDIEARLARSVPSLTITDRRVVLRPVRLASRLVDERGRATEVVSLDTRTKAGALDGSPL